MANFYVSVDCDLSRNYHTLGAYRVTIYETNAPLRALTQDGDIWNNNLAKSCVVASKSEAIEIALAQIAADLEMHELTDHQDGTISYRVTPVGHKFGFGYESHILARKTADGVYRAAVAQ